MDLLLSATRPTARPHDGACLVWPDGHIVWRVKQACAVRTGGRGQVGKFVSSPSHCARTAAWL
ncbi:MAG: hypothetical protein ACRDUV_19540, partial [Pseudonocardiaceae bacterium]